MSFAQRGGIGRLVGRSVGAIAAAILLAVLLVLPAAAAKGGATQLSEPHVSPSSGTTATTFTFSVLYKNSADKAPDNVNVLIDLQPRTMSSAGTDWKSGVTFTLATKLVAGKHTIAFEAVEHGKVEDTAGGGVVTVTVPPPPPAPTPTPTPKATPRPTPTPTPRPAPTPTPAPKSTPAAAPTPAPTPAPGGTADPGVAVGPSPDASGGAIGSGTPEPSSSPDSSNGPGSSAGSAGAGVSGGPDDAGTSSDGANPGSGTGDGSNVDEGGWSQMVRYLQDLGIRSDTWKVGLLPSLVSSAGGMTMLMAFLFFGKRRRDGEQPAPDEVLSAAAARGLGQGSTSTLVPEGPGTFDAEAGMPRWRRPSLLEARKADPLRNGSVPVTMTFAHGAAGTVDGHERRLIRYNVVRLLDAPDELRSADIGSLIQGDEVQLLERSGTYWLVLCPDGRQGWIHKMTLGDVVGDVASPTARETWSTTAGNDDVDDDVLTAFLTARGQA